MSTLSLRLPESLHRKIRELAARDEISINQFIATAVAEKTSALLTVEYLEERAKQGDRAKFGEVLARVRSRPPLKGDEWSAPRPATTSRRAGRKRPGERRSNRLKG